MERILTAGAMALALALFAAPAPAGDLEFYTGDMLYAQCSAKPADADYPAREARCSGYVMGVSDLQQAAQGAGGPVRVCLPATAASPAIVAAVSAYLQAHPDSRPHAATDIVLDALSAQFPCK